MQKITFWDNEICWRFGFSGIHLNTWRLLITCLICIISLGSLDKLRCSAIWSTLSNAFYILIFLASPNAQMSPSFQSAQPFCVWVYWQNSDPLSALYLCIRGPGLLGTHRTFSADKPRQTHFQRVTGTGGEWINSVYLGLCILGITVDSFSASMEGG